MLVINKYYLKQKLLTTLRKFFYYRKGQLLCDAMRGKDALTLLCTSYKL